MKTISIYKVRFRKSRTFKFECRDYYGNLHTHTLLICSLAEFSTCILTLSVFMFTEIKVYLSNPHNPDMFNILVAL